MTVMSPLTENEWMLHYYYRYVCKRVFNVLVCAHMRVYVQCRCFCDCITQISDWPHLNSLLRLCAITPSLCVSTVRNMNLD